MSTTGDLKQLWFILLILCILFEPLACRRGGFSLGRGSSSARSSSIGRGGSSSSRGIFGGRSGKTGGSSSIGRGGSSSSRGIFGGSSGRNTGGGIFGGSSGRNTGGGIFGGSSGQNTGGGIFGGSSGKTSGGIFGGSSGRNTGGGHYTGFFGGSSGRNIGGGNSLTNFDSSNIGWKPSVMGGAIMPGHPKASGFGRSSSGNNYGTSSGFGRNKGGTYTGGNSGWKSGGHKYTQGSGVGSLARSNTFKNAIVGAAAGHLIYQGGKHMIRSATAPMMWNNRQYYWGVQYYQSRPGNKMCRMPIEPTDQHFNYVYFQNQTRPREIVWGCGAGEVCCGSECCRANGGSGWGYGGFGLWYTALIPVGLNLLMLI